MVGSYDPDTVSERLTHKGLWDSLRPRTHLYVSFPTSSERYYDYTLDVPQYRRPEAVQGGGRLYHRGHDALCIRSKSRPSRLISKQAGINVLCLGFPARTFPASALV